MTTEMPLSLLRGLCAGKGLSQAGNKTALVQRLTDDANGVPRKKPGRPPISTSENSSNIMAKFGFKTRDDMQSAQTAVPSALAGYAASSKKSKKPAGIVPTIHVTSTPSTTKNVQDKQDYISTQYNILAKEGWRDISQMHQEAEDRWKKKQSLEIIHSNKKHVAIPKKPTKTIAKTKNATLPTKTDEYTLVKEHITKRLIAKKVPKALMRAICEAFGHELPKATKQDKLAENVAEQMCYETDSDDDEEEDEEDDDENEEDDDENEEEDDEEEDDEDEDEDEDED